MMRPNWSLPDSPQTMLNEEVHLGFEADEIVCMRDEGIRFRLFKEGTARKLRGWKNEKMDPLPFFKFLQCAVEGVLVRVFAPGQPAPSLYNGLAGRCRLNVHEACAQIVGFLDTGWIFVVGQKHVVIAGAVKRWEHRLHPRHVDVLIQHCASIVQEVQDQMGAMGHDRRPQFAFVLCVGVGIFDILPIWILIDIEVHAHRGRQVLQRWHGLPCFSDYHNLLGCGVQMGRRVQQPILQHV
mmetsp:Transcript_88668/g.255698  ORF Transcript_88668/g.255698 Transcript_88668/m.255698 type:complete len:239 (+) Transcript_88668:99-815(+)|eukprot:CAMPEP_0176073452 /NCGR_PEP_ID=MMETSP0120_2-20121206/36701_1 /TAXON_ID=160619 /ORGANISM="Kryptoperidinium foliaceum, Strain CCMP 1326" /LENGTH=238 /DNA_ID=CAMNT_0017407135 /DNA_START=78 /DNA_END=794 /DNA_ORIENTATION=+